MSVLAWLVAKAAILLFGFPVAFLPPVRKLGIAARLSAAYGGGTIALTLYAILLSAVGVKWSVAAIAIPLGVIAIVATVALARRSNDPLVQFDRWTLAGLIAVVLGWLHWTLSVFSTRATSADYLYFWGSKAVRIARAGGLDPALLGDPFMLHLRPQYPPLVPVTYAWNILVSGSMHWRLSMLDSALWLVAGSLLLHALLLEKMPVGRASQVTAFWTVAMAVSFATSYSSGNAEAPLVYFTSVAAASMLAGKSFARWLAPLALAGCLLTKSEGTLIFTALIAATVIVRLVSRERLLTRDLVLCVALPLLALSAWYGYELAKGLSLSDPLRQNVLFSLDFTKMQRVVLTMLDNLDAGTWGVSWLLPLCVFAVSVRGWRQGGVGALAAAGLIAFYLVYYLHEQRPLDIVMWWEIPRITQPPLALLIIGAGAASAVVTSAPAEEIR